MQENKRKFEAEKGSEPKKVAEQEIAKPVKKYNPQQLVEAIEDLAIEVNNAYFRHPFNKCPDCHKKSVNAVLVHFGHKGANTLGNLKGFQATIGDIISWHADTYKGMSIICGKDNGTFEIVTSPFDIPRKEPAIIERIVIPEKYRSIIGEMANYKSGYFPSKWKSGLTVKIGRGEYPDVIKEEL